ncbi:MAG: aspartate 1-decarboxylase [candidate division WOR-3 bacterium]
MLRKFVKSKIQGLRITDKQLHYEGSLELAADLLDAADILPGEMVQVVNINNGKRWETYCIAGPAGSGVCVLKGAAARLGEVGDEIIVMSIALLDAKALESYKMIKVKVDQYNRLSQIDRS